jgi:hypothetical protein
MGINELILLSTRTMQWYEERGFIQVELLLILHILIGKVNCPYSFKIEQSDPSALPITRKYDSTRGSKVYIKVKILITTKKILYHKILILFIFLLQKLGSQRDIDVEELLWQI